ncbi:MAG: hypothetical protein J0I32_20150 [Sphingobacteriales bacterium]|nr:hypothetical protein [Sphingobacteriales bacterium]OJV98821.1 MAG: hypothetical protein BGO52_08615 [Sphingobacteriales bacterium 44-61]
MEKNSALQIDIAGNRYHIDASQDNLLPIDKDLAIIPTGNLEIAMDHEWERFGYYDLIHRCLYHPPEHIDKLPENVIGFSIPSYQDISEAKNRSLIVYAETVDLKDTKLAVEVEENKIRSLDQRKRKKLCHPKKLKKKTGRNL